MARFEGTLNNLRAIASHMPAALEASSVGGTGGQKQGDMVKELINELRKEDNNAITIANLVQTLIKKFGGRSV